MSAPHIGSYGWSPDLVFLGGNARSDALYIGIELEVELVRTDPEYYSCEGCGHECESEGEGESPAEFWRGIYSHAVERVGGVDLGRNLLPYFATHDGSLDNGVELTTHPMTPDVARSLSLWGTVESGYYGGYVAEYMGTAGLHVHMSRTAFTPRSMANFLSLHKWSRRLLESIGGRSWYGYCDAGSGGTAERIADIADNEWTAYGRGAVNLQGAHTVELRYPAGIPHRDHVLSIIDMVESLHTFASAAAASDVIGHGAPNRYWHYVSELGDRWPYLADKVAGWSREYPTPAARSAKLIDHIASAKKERK